MWVGGAAPPDGVGHCGHIVAGFGPPCKTRSAGHDGGRVVFTGTPAELVDGADTLTARHLRAYLGR